MVKKEIEYSPLNVNLLREGDDDLREGDLVGFLLLYRLCDSVSVDD